MIRGMRFAWVERMRSTASLASSVIVLAIAGLAASCGNTTRDGANATGGAGGGSAGSGAGGSGAGGSAGCGPQPPGLDCWDCDFNFTSPTCSGGSWVCPDQDCGDCGRKPASLSCKDACTQQAQEPICQSSVWTCPAPRSCAGTLPRAFDNAHEADLAVGPDGVIAVTGWFSDAVDFGAGSHSAIGERDAFVVAFAPDDKTLWSMAFGGSKRVEPSSIARTPSGELVVCGRLEGSVTFGATPLSSAGAPDQFIALLDQNGQTVWAKRFDARACSVEVEPDGEIVLAGFFGDSIDHDSFDLGGGPVATTGAADIYVTKLAATGAHIWTRTHAGDSWDYASALTILPNGNITVVGTFKGTLDVGGGPLPSPGLFDGFVLTLDPSGAHVASFSFGGPGDDGASSVAPHPGAADLLIAAHFEQEMKLGTASYKVSGTDASDPDGLIITVDVDGTNASAAQIRGVTDTVFGFERWQVTSSPGGEWVAAGAYQAALEVGGVSLPSAGNYDIGVARDTGSGWAAHRYGDALADVVTAIAIGPNGQLVMTGHVWGAPDFGAGPLGPGADRMFVADLPIP